MVCSGGDSSHSMMFNKDKVANECNFAHMAVFAANSHSKNQAETAMGPRGDNEKNTGGRSRPEAVLHKSMHRNPLLSRSGRLQRPVLRLYHPAEYSCSRRGQPKAGKSCEDGVIRRVLWTLR